MSLTYDQVLTRIRNEKFYHVAHVVVQHHLRKEFQELEISRDRFYIKPVGQDFLHVAIVEVDNGREQYDVQVKYTCAGDDLLYGLSQKFRSGGSDDPQVDLDSITALIANGNLREHARYIRKRFRHGRFQAKFRATLIYLRDQWRSLWPRKS